jgi:threonine/homoserine/homoserine lactone efflux protein
MDNNLLAFVLAVLTISLIPGMNVLIVCSQSMQYGFKKSLAGIAGVITGNVIYFFIAFAGTNLILKVLPAVFFYVKIFGIGFILYSATRLIIAGLKTSTSAQPAVLKDSKSNLFFQGFLTHMANPKAFIFWITVLPGFIDTTTDVSGQLIRLGALAILLDTSVLTGYSSLANFSLKYLSGSSQRFQYLFSGIILVIVAIWLAFL